MEVKFLLLVIRHLPKGRIKEKGDNLLASLNALNADLN